MTHTVVSSATREVVIGFGRPFVMIGERINPTGRKLLAEEMRNGDFSRVEADAVAQVEAGAHMLDVNAGIPLADEPALLAKAVQLVQSVTDVPLSIDSSIVEALEAGLAVYQGKPLVNSVTGEDEVMERVLPLVARHGAAVVAISNDETGISDDIDVRFAVAKRIVERAADHGIPAADVVVDPLVMPIGALGDAGQKAFALIRRLREELRVNTTCGASNISFGLPNRHVVTGTFLAMAIGAGMTSAIMSPLHPEVKSAVMAADVLAGVDRDCMAWIRANRDPNAPAASGAGARVAGAAAPRSDDRDRVPPRRLHALGAGGQGGRTGPASSRPPASSAPTSTPCAAAVASAGAARSRPASGASPSGRSTPRRTPSSAPAAIETDYHANRPLAPGNRLGCAARIVGDVVVDVPAASQVHRQVVRKDLDLAPVTVDPSFSLYYVEVPAARLGDGTRSAAAALADAVADQHGIERPTCRRRAAARRSTASLAVDGGAVTVAVTRRRTSSSRSGRATSTPRTASPSTSARPRSPGISATCPAARCSPRRGG